MKAITLRNIPPKVQKVIRDRARRKRISADRAVIDLLQEQVEVRQRGEDGLYHDLDHLIGTMSAEEADELWGFVKEQREFDKQFFGK
jgi:hypothetical protein